MRCSRLSNSGWTLSESALAGLDDCGQWTMEYVTAHARSPPPDAAKPMPLPGCFDPTASTSPAWRPDTIDESLALIQELPKPWFIRVAVRCHAAVTATTLPVIMFVL